MEFYKETIMGQVLTQVHAEKSNGIYFEQIDELLEDIMEHVYMNESVELWQKHGLYITDLALTKAQNNKEWVYVEAADAFEYSWLIERLFEIYKPKITESYRLLTTLGYLLNVYGERFDSLTEILRITTVTSTVFLHEDHIGQDKFKVHPITLPPFGREF